MFNYPIIILAQEIPRKSDNIFGDTFAGFVGQIPIILVLQVCLAALLLVGAAIYFINRRRNLAQQKQAAEGGLYTTAAEMPDIDLLIREAHASAPPERTARPGVFNVSLHTGRETEASEVLAILRDVQDGRLIIQMGETAYRTLVDTPEVKKEFTQIMKELSEVVLKPDENADKKPLRQEIAPTLPVAMPSQETDLPALDDLVGEPPTAAAAVPPPPAKPKAPARPRPPITPEGTMPGDLASYKLEDNPVKITKGGLLKRQKYESAPIPELDIARAIEAYLQHKLLHTEEFDGRSIHIHSGVGGGVRIEVDGKFFEAVSDVDEPDIRDFLTETIQEWQDRQ